jgi:cytochrome c oxidase subunit 4
MATQTHAHDAHPAHHSHAKLYYIIWAVLLICTALTVVTAKMDLGSIALAVALAIATLKGTLVVLYFMHLTEAPGTVKLVLATCVLFLVLMISFQLGDFSTRFPALNSEGSRLSALPAPPLPGAPLPEGPREVGTTP